MEPCYMPKYGSIRPRYSTEHTKYSTAENIQQICSTAIITQQQYAQPNLCWTRKWQLNIVNFCNNLKISYQSDDAYLTLTMICEPTLNFGDCVNGLDNWICFIKMNTLPKQPQSMPGQGKVIYSFDLNEPWSVLSFCHADIFSHQIYRW